MATVRFSPQALEDLERLAGFLKESDPAAAAATIPLLFEGLKLLATHPLIGRVVAPGRRELLVFRGRTGYLAQYSFRPAADEVVVLALRHQREAGD